jgi:predicted site-specific integrase-resolvase
MEQEYYTPRQVAQRLRVDDTSVMRWIRTGLLDVETIKEGRHNRHSIKKATIATEELVKSEYDFSSFPRCM